MRGAAFQVIVRHRWGGRNKPYELPKLPPEYDPRPLWKPVGEVTYPLTYVDESEKYKRPPTEPRGDMTVEKFLKTIGRGCEDHLDDFEDWSDLMTARGFALKQRGIPVRQRRWILRWVEHYKQGRDPVHIPLVSRAKKNKFLSRKKPKTVAEKRRIDVKPPRYPNLHLAKQ